jgi:hypothetical protein
MKHLLVSTNYLKKSRGQNCPRPGGHWFSLYAYSKNKKQIFEKTQINKYSDSGEWFRAIMAFFKLQIYIYYLSFIITHMLCDKVHNSSMTISRNYSPLNLELMLTNVIFSSTIRRIWRAIAVTPASSSTFASASALVKVFCKVKCVNYCLRYSIETYNTYLK